MKLTKEEKENRKKDKEREWRMFQKIWKQRPHKSQISATWLGQEALTVFFHHILPKENYEEARFDEDNIILLTFDEHTQVHNNPTRYPLINEKREQLKKKYEGSN